MSVPYMKFSVKYRSVDSDIYVIMYICVCVYICIYMRNIDTTLLTEIIRIQAFMRIKGELLQKINVWSNLLWIRAWMVVCIAFN